MHISRRGFILLVLLGVSVRLLLIATSIGTNDVINWMTFARLVDHVGIGPAYARIAEVNHPPLSLLILLLLEKIRQTIGLEIGDLLRLTQAGFDLLAVSALLRIGRFLEWPSPRGLALFYFLSPVSIFVSGFHGNTDPAMVALLLTALSLLLRAKPLTFLAGVVFGAAVGIKVVPLLMLPLIVLWRSDRFRFLAGFAAAITLIFLPFLFTGGMTVIERIFGYNTEPGNAGLALFLFSIAREADGALRDVLIRIGYGWTQIARHAVLISIAAYSLAYALRAERNGRGLLAGCGIILLIALTLSPGGGMQYLIWPIAFLPFATTVAERWIIVGMFSIGQFTSYTIWSDGFPWWYADSTIRRPDMNVAWLGNIVFVTLSVITIRAVLRTLRVRTEPRPS